MSHLSRGNRLVVQVLIDGQEPDPSRLGVVRRERLDGHELFIETADARELALEALAHVEEQLKEADRLRAEAAELLGRGLHVRAMEKLSGCFSTWQHAHESVLKTAQLMRIDLAEVDVGGGATLDEMLGEFTGQLRAIKRSLEGRDFATLTEILTYEPSLAGARWRAALVGLRGRMG